MRKNIVAGNWKMNTTLPEGLALAKGLDEALKGKTPNCDVIIGTPFTHLASVAAAIDTNKIGVAAENCADKEKGAYTGEVSAAMVASTGAKYVILGHSERRAYYHETPEILKTKVELALANGLTPIFCIGEVLEEREVIFAEDVEKIFGKRPWLSRADEILQEEEKAVNANKENVPANEGNAAADEPEMQPAEKAASTTEENKPADENKASQNDGNNTEKQ